MSRHLSPSVAQTAVNLSESHPQAKPIEVLDLVMQGRAGVLADLGGLHPTTPFGQLIAAAFDPAMDPRDWQLIAHPNTEAAVQDLLWDIWKGKVLPAFAARYSLVQ